MAGWLDVSLHILLTASPLWYRFDPRASLDHHGGGGGGVDRLGYPALCVFALS